MASCSALCLGCGAQKHAEDVPPIPAEPERLLELGLGRERAGDGLRAEQYYEAALALGADPDVIYPRIIAVCLAGGRLSSAFVHVEHALEHAPDEPHLLSLRDALGRALQP